MCHIVVSQYHMTLAPQCLMILAQQCHTSVVVDVAFAYDSKKYVRRHHQQDGYSHFA